MDQAAGRGRKRRSPQVSLQSSTGKARYTRRLRSGKAEIESAATGRSPTVAHQCRSLLTTSAAVLELMSLTGPFLPSEPVRLITTL